MIRFLFLLLSLSVVTTGNSQEESNHRDYFGVKQRRPINDKKGTYYISFGYNKNWYSKSDIHVHDPNGKFDFILHDMRAYDRPQVQDIFRVAISIPQYSYRMGYWLPGSMFGVEINFDHAKYILYNYQTVKLTGQINGTSYNQDTLVSHRFLAMEHTDGANFLMFNFMGRIPLWQRPLLSIFAVSKVGAGIVVPRSDVTLFGERVNHNFHVAGEVYGIEAGVRTVFLKYLFLETTGKGVFCNFRNVFATGDALISHKFWDGMALVTAGFNVPIGSGKMRGKYISGE
jgi:hypothetical protein